MPNILISNMMLCAYYSPSSLLSCLTYYVQSCLPTHLSICLSCFFDTIFHSLMCSFIPPFTCYTVAVGDCIMTVTGEEKVTSVERVWGEGVYTVVTNAEYVVVNGIIASPFGVNHVMGNLYYNVHRMVYASAPALLKLYWLSSANEVCLLSSRFIVMKLITVIASYLVMKHYLMS